MNELPSPETRLATHAGFGCLRGVLLQLFVVCTVGPAMVGVVGLVLVLAQAGHPFLAMVSGMACTGSLIGAFGGTAFAWNQRQLRALDPGFAALGDVRGAMFLQNGRSWRGEVGGRRLDAYLYRGPTLEIYLSGQIRSRFGAGWPGLLSGVAARAFGRERLTPLGPELEKIEVYPSDPVWASSVLADPRAAEALARLLADGASGGVRMVQALPDAVMLRIARVSLGGVPEGAVRAWVADLAVLAAAAEGVVPAELLESTGLEVANRTARGRVAGRISCVIFLLFGALFALLLAVGLAAAFFLE